MSTEAARMEGDMAGPGGREPRTGARSRVLKRITGILAGVAGLGAILGGLTGYWTTYRTVRTEFSLPADTDASDGRLSIVVLPFTNLSGDRTQDYFTDGLTDSLTTDLSQALPGSFVVGRETAFTYKGRAADVRQIHHDLGVRYMLEGSVLPNQEKVRVNARLVDALTTRGLWSERFDSVRGDILQVQDEIVARISRAVGLQVTDLEARRSQRQAKNPEAVDFVMRARAVTNRPTSMASMIEARELFDKAVQLQPNNVDALAGLATTYLFEVLNDYYPAGNEQRLERAHELLAQALAIDGQHLAALKAKSALLRAKGQFNEGIATARMVLAQNPGEPWAYKEIGLSTLYLGRPGEALDWFAKAERIGPRDPGQWTWLSSKGHALILLGRDNEAIAALRVALNANPKASDTYALLAAAYALAGNKLEAHAALAQYEQYRPGMHVSAYRVRAPVPIDLTAPAYQRQRERLKQGLRLAGMPE